MKPIANLLVLIGLCAILALAAYWIAERIPVRGDAGNLEFALGVGR